MSRRAAMVAAAALVAALVGWKGWLLHAQDHTLHQDPDDYAALSLGHAINVDFWAERFPERAIGYFQVTHPGLPLQATSWALYRVAGGGGANATERAISNLSNPAGFWRADRIAAAALFLATVLAALAVAFTEAGALAFILPLAALAFAPGWPYFLEQLGNESFALPIFFALWLAVRRALATPPRALPWLVVGAVGGIAYLNKLNYVAWLVAATLASLHQALAAPGPLLRRARAPLAVGIGAAASITGIGAAFLGPRGLAAMLETHRGFLLNTGIFGSGDRGVVKPSVAWANFVQFVAADWAFTAWLVAAIALLAWARPWRPRPGDAAGEDPSLASSRRSMALFLGAAIALSFLAAMKHYFPRYLVPMVVAIGFALLELRHRLAPPVVAALLGLTLVVDVRAAWLDRERVLAAEQVVRATDAEVRAVRAMPVAPDALRVWSYKVLAPEYSASFVIDNSGHPDLLARFYPGNLPGEVAFFKGIADWVPWQYVVFERGEYGSQDLRWLKPITEVAFEGKHLVVLRRRGAP